MKTTATLKVEFDPGADIESSFEEAIRISYLLKCYVEFEFNGVTCITDYRSSPSIGVRNYQREIASKSTVKIATGY